MFPVGITTGYGLPINGQTFREMKENRIDYLELSLGRDYGTDFRTVGKQVLDAGIGIWSAHLPFRPTDRLDISLESPELRRNTVAYFTELIETISDLGVDKFVIHPSTPLPVGASREERIKCSMDTLDKLAEVAARCGVALAVEDMVTSCIGCNLAEFGQILSANEKLRVCLDTNHLLTCSHEAFIREFGSKIITLHISDYTGDQERHWFPGEGIVNWPEIPKLLKSAGYNGVWMYELSLNGAKSVDRGRPLTFRDFRRNADEIFAGKNPTVIKL